VRILSVALGLGALLLSAGTAHAQTVSVGDPAPKLEVKEFVKGEPVKGFEKGKTYVVEFWATWCGPCRTSIPHLTELANKNPEVAFIGVSVWETNPAAVVPFVTQMGEKMAYRVATDVVPDGGKGGDGVMASTWMKAAGQDGIPAAFVINKDGKIAWVGHPMALEKPLEQILKGDWDLAKAAAEFKTETAAKVVRRDKIIATNKRLSDAEKEGGPAGVLAEIDKMIAEDPSAEDTLSYRKFEILSRPDGDVDAALAFGTRLVEKLYAGKANYMGSFASSLLLYRKSRYPQAAPLDPRLVKLGLDAALKADALYNGKSAPTAQALARGYFLTGQPAKAVEAQERAIKLIQDGGQTAPVAYQKALDEYRQAAQRK
jgi:thiol-disulfide isomerase/thioredoxin